MKHCKKKKSQSEEGSGLLYLDKPSTYLNTIERFELVNSKTTPLELTRGFAICASFLSI